jgi:hypothetical protein
VPHRVLSLCLSGFRRFQFLAHAGQEKTRRYRSGLFRVCSGVCRHALPPPATGAHPPRYAPGLRCFTRRENPRVRAERSTGVSPWQSSRKVYVSKQGKSRYVPLQSWGWHAKASATIGPNGIYPALPASTLDAGAQTTTDAAQKNVTDLQKLAAHYCQSQPLTE